MPGQPARIEGQISSKHFPDGLADLIVLHRQERQAHHLADSTVRAVGTDDEGWRERPAFARGPCGLHMRTFVSRTKGVHLHPLDNLRAEGPSTVCQQALGLILRRDENEAEPAWQPAQVNIDASEQVEVIHSATAGDQVICYPAGVEQLQGPGVHDAGPGRLRITMPALQHCHGYACCSEVTGEQQAGGARPDNEHVDGVGRHGAWIPPFLGQRSMPSATASAGALSGLDDEDLARHRRGAYAPGGCSSTASAIEGQLLAASSSQPRSALVASVSFLL